MSGKVPVGLLDLPAELRDNIWKLVLPTIVHVTERQTFYCDHSAAANLAVLFVSHQFHDEANDVLLRKSQVFMLVNENSCMRKGTHKEQSSTTLLSVVPSAWKTSLRQRIRRVRHLCINVDLTGNWRISQGAIAEILEVLKLAENLIDLELVVTEPRYAVATSPLILPENAALMSFLRLEYPGMKSSTITVTNIPRHFERSFSKLIQSKGWTGAYIVRETDSSVLALQR